MRMMTTLGHGDLVEPTTTTIFGLAHCYSKTNLGDNYVVVVAVLVVVAVVVVVVVVFSATTR